MIIAEQLRQLGSTDISEIAPELAVSTRDLQPLANNLASETASLRKYLHPQPASGIHRTPGLWESDLGVVDVGRESGYRTRIDLDVDAQGRAGMKKHRSHEIQPLTAMPLATTELQTFAEHIGLWNRQWPLGARLKLVAPSGGQPPRIYVNG